MKILVDADACPNAIKDIIYRASNRLNIEVILFANHFINIPKSSQIRFVKVEKGFDVADNEIEKMVNPKDLVITADVPLADAVIDKHATAINIRGTLYTKDNIKEKLRIRNIVTELRDTGHTTKGPAPLNNKDIQQFANALDSYLAKNFKSS